MSALSQAALLGTQDRAKESTVADQIQAERQQLEAQFPGHALRKANQQSASYEGKIASETHHFVLQLTSSRTGVLHDKQDLPKIPQVGQEVRINYAASLATVKELPTRTLSQDRSACR
jgi:hypothetical protein